MILSFFFLLNDPPNAYEKEVIYLLKSEITSETGTDRNVRTNYRYLYKDKVYEFDMVVLDDQGNILKIYEIKTHSAVKTIPNTINKLLQTYKEIAKEDAYLVYLDKGLHIISQSTFAKKRKKTKSSSLTIKSFSEYYLALTKIRNYNEDMFFFRGHSDFDYSLRPSLYRDDRFVDNENELYREAIRHKPSEFTEDMSTFDKLVKMQHYGLPTRLLDITSNPLVALYFACQEKKDDNNQEKDGEVLIFDIPENQAEFFDSTTVCILSNLAKQTKDFSLEKNKYLLAESIKQDKPYFSVEKLKSDAVNQTICVRPKLNNERILRQDGAFFIFGIDGDNKRNVKKLEDDPITLRIKADCKGTILKELQHLGINKASLFPETENVMQEIKSSCGK